MVAALKVTTIGEGIIWASAVIGGIAVIFRVFGTYILKPYSHAQDEKDDARLAAQLAPIIDELAVVRGELQFNGGTTTKDAVRRIDQRLTRMEGRFEEHDRWTRHDAVDPDQMEPGL